MSLRQQHPTFWRLGLRSLWRDLRAGELRLLMLAVLLAVAALCAVGFFSDRIQGALQRDARALLGGDVVIVSDNPLPPEFAQRAAQDGLRQTESLSFPTMARAPDVRGGAARLVALKAVQPGYPLRGELRLHVAQNTPEATVQTVAATTLVDDEKAPGIPPQGQVWIDAALLQALDLQLGDELLLGDARLIATRLIAREPDRGAGFMNFAPRVLMNRADLAATGLVQPASRITWRQALAADGPGASERIAAFAAWAGQRIKAADLRGLRVESLENGRPEMRQTLDRASKFLNLVALLAALLSAVAVALAARSFAASHLDDCAMLRVLGQRQRTMVAAYTLEFVLVGLLASTLGVALGWAVHHLFVWLLAGLLGTTLPAASLWPALFGMGMGLTLLLAFGLPPVLQLAQVPPLRVIRRDVGNLKPASLLVLGVGVAGFAALLLVVSADLKLGLIAVGGFAAAVAVFAATSALVVRLLRKSINEATAPRWMVLAARQMAARPAYTVVQVSSLAVGLMALVLLILLRTDLIHSWRQATPANAPNRFVINVMPEQADAFQQALHSAGVAQYDWYPMIRGRLVAVNGKPISPDDYPQDRAKRLIDREFNLSHTAQHPAHNTLVAGRWQAEEADAVSVEEGLAQTLGLKLGDTLRFDVGGIDSQARITSLRKVDWGSMHANFFVIYPVSRMDDLPATWMAAFRAPPQPGFDNTLVRQFPNITSVDMSQTLAQVQDVLNQVIAAVEYLFGFTLAAGLIVLLAAVSATREERAREFAIMRAVGARASLLAQVQRAELMGVGLLAGIMASAVATAVGWALARYVFEFDWGVSLWVLPAGGMAGALLALAAGWWALRDVLRRPVVQTLRRAAQ